ncbi:MAG: dihydrolipoyl dehydrogenase [Saccharospirillum sp.]|uniref:dihydrolipoyl dehydrogenase n=1 Tax=Saccharospirillum sp. TaxID=2033801 RepID=UPI0032968D6E
MATTLKTEVLVLGSGPGGYSAAFRLADLGKEVTLVERFPTLGGVCLNVGCIPSKALLHVAAVLTEARESDSIGIQFGEPKVDLDAVRAFKQRSVDKLVGGVGGMAKSLRVEVVQGYGTFKDAHRLEVTGSDTNTLIEFDHCVIAAGSAPVQLPFVPHNDDRIWDSTKALELPFIPQRLLVIGGGIIGLEMATVYQALGSDVTVVEFAAQLIPAADSDLVKVYQRFNKDRFNVHLKTRVTAVDALPDGLNVTIEDANGTTRQETYDALLVAVGRRPNGNKIGADHAGIRVDERGFIEVDKQLRTSVPHIFAIGDIIGNPMLAHKASHEGHVAAEVIAGHKAVFEPKAIPSIAYTNPEIAWTGLTEKEAKTQGLNVETAIYPWTASGRAIGADRSEGKTKLIFHKDKGTLLGAGIVGINAGELLGELSLALEFGADIEDIALTIHAHPTLHETVGLAAELGAGTITDLPNPKIKKRA